MPDVVSPLSFPDLQALAEADPEALVAHLCATRDFEEQLVGVLPQIQASPLIIQGLRDGVSASWQRTLRQWLVRDLLAPCTTTEAFCAEATACARRQEADFPALEASALVLVGTWYVDRVREADTRVDGRGWVASLSEREIGPAETVHVEEWWATAHGAGWRQRIGRLAGRDAGWTWAEPLEPTAG